MFTYLLCTDRLPYQVKKYRSSGAQYFKAPAFSILAVQALAQDITAVTVSNTADSELSSYYAHHHHHHHHHFRLFIKLTYATYIRLQ